jgi:hypothetical protein
MNLPWFEFGKIVASGWYRKQTVKATQAKDFSGSSRAKKMALDLNLAPLVDAVPSPVYSWPTFGRQRLNRCS